jgi:hypothetical protein
MSGFVDRDPAPLVGVVADWVGEPDLDRELGLDHIGHRHRGTAVAQGDDQRFVEEPFDAHGGVTTRDVGDVVGSHR